MKTQPKRERGDARPRRCRGEDGLTLQEMLIAMVVSAIIAVPIGGALYTSLHTTSATLNRTSESVGANVLSNYFGTDVQNAAQVTTNTTTACLGSQPVGLLLTATNGVSSIAYYQGTAPGTTTNLYRSACTSAGVLKSTAVTMRNLAPVASPVTYSCLDASGTAIACGPTWSGVRIVATQADSRNAGPYKTTVQAQRRVS